MRFSCQSCQASYSIPDARVADKIVHLKCQKCGAEIVVKGPRTQAAASAPADASAFGDAPEEDEEPIETTRIANLSELENMRQRALQPQAAAPAEKRSARVNDEADEAGDNPWHVMRQKEQLGPFADAEIIAQIKRGDIDARTYVWREGMAEWARLGEVAELKGHLPVAKKPASVAKSATDNSAVPRGAGRGESMPEPIAKLPEPATIVPGDSAERPAASGENAFEALFGAKSESGDFDALFGNKEAGEVPPPPEAAPARPPPPPARPPPPPPLMRDEPSVAPAAEEEPLGTGESVAGLGFDQLQAELGDLSGPGTGRHTLPPAEAGGDERKRNQQLLIAVVAGIAGLILILLLLFALDIIPGTGGGDEEETVDRADRGSPAAASQPAKVVSDEERQRIRDQLGAKSEAPAEDAKKATPKGEAKAEPGRTRAPEGTAAPAAAAADDKPAAKDAKAEQKLDAAQITRVVAANQTMIKSCYERELKRGGETLRGKLLLEFTISNDGKVAKAAVKTPTFKDTPLGECVVGAAKTWKFPAFSGDSVSVEYPFLLSPAETP